MKKLISILIAIIIFTTTLVGCTVGIQTDSNTRDYTTKGKETKLVADETATGELTVSWCGNDFNADGNAYYKSVEIFKSLYPNVNIQFEHLNLMDFPASQMDSEFENYFQKLETEIMAGKGPDVFELVGDIMDIDKIIRSSVLADMYDYFENDPDFNADDYNQAILKSGQYNGGQYIIPRAYVIPFFMTTKEIATVIGYDENKEMDYFETWNFLLKMSLEYRDEFSSEKLIGNMAMSDMFPYISGINFVDKEKMKSNFETEAFKKAVEKQKEALKTYSYTRLFTSGGNNGVNELKRKEAAMWAFPFEGLNPILENMRRLGVEETIIIPFRDISKRIQVTPRANMAVSGNSKNKENAYRFIKILINEEVSSRYDENLGVIEFGIPVSNIATKKLLEQSMQDEVMMYSDGANHGYKEVEGASQEFVDNYLEMINDIGGVFTNSPVMKLIQEAFQPYFDDEMSYEKCLETARDAVDIYLSE